MKIVPILVLFVICGSAFADCEDSINNMTDGASIKIAMKCLNKMQSEIASKQPSPTSIELLPQKAVVAFNLDVCPYGWQPFKAGEGRVIVGSGRGNGLSARVLGDLGGFETHTLTLTEIPSHTHPHTDDGVYHNPPNNKYEGLRTEFRGDSSVGLTHGARDTSATGGGQAHNIMQPFVVLKLCEKQ
jgi:hypothetical protein